MTETVISKEVATAFEEGNHIKLTNAKSLDNKNINSRGFKSLDASNSKINKRIFEKHFKAIKATFGDESHLSRLQTSNFTLTLLHLKHSRKKVCEEGIMEYLIYTNYNKSVQKIKEAFDNDVPNSYFRKCDMIQIKVDHSSSVMNITVVFTCIIVGEDNCCISILRQIWHNVLVCNLTCVEIVVWLLYDYAGERWMVEEFIGEEVTGSKTCTYDIRTSNKN